MRILCSRKLKAGINVMKLLIFFNKGHKLNQGTMGWNTFWISIWFFVYGKEYVQVFWEGIRLRVCFIVLKNNNTNSERILPQCESGRESPKATADHDFAKTLCGSIALSTLPGKIWILPAVQPNTHATIFLCTTRVHSVLKKMFTWMVYFVLCI